jgi:hypothetical protein
MTRKSRYRLARLHSVAATGSSLVSRPLSLAGQQHDRLISTVGGRGVAWLFILERIPSRNACPFQRYSKCDSSVRHYVALVSNTNQTILLNDCVAEFNQGWHFLAIAAARVYSLAAVSVIGTAVTGLYLSRWFSRVLTDLEVPVPGPDRDTFPGNESIGLAA